MSAVAHIDVRYVANLARLSLTDGEAAAFQAQLDRVLEYVASLQSVDTSGVEVTAHPLGLMDCLRPDESIDSFGAENALLNAPRRAQDQFLVPKVVE